MVVRLRQCELIEPREGLGKSFLDSSRSRSEAVIIRSQWYELRSCACEYRRSRDNLARLNAYCWQCRAVSAFAYEVTPSCRHSRPSRHPRSTTS